jgi:hypothetical protein
VPIRPPYAVGSVGKKPTDRPGKEESRKVMIGIGETKAPILYVTKLFE